MPQAKLREIRAACPVAKLDDPITGVPYWVVTRIAEMDHVSKNPKLFSSAARSAFPMEYPQEMVEGIHSHTIYNPERQMRGPLARGSALFRPRNRRLDHLPESCRYFSPSDLLFAQHSISTK